MPHDVDGLIPLPPGQWVARAHPRFGLGRFRQKRLDLHAATDVLWADGQGDNRQLFPELARLVRIEQVSDLHCVTTWSVPGIRWSGWRFRDVYAHLTDNGVPEIGCQVVFHGIDGYRSILPLEDLMAGDVMLADRINDQSLGLDHGGPLRLVAPAHYGYKSVKHLGRIELRASRRGYRFPWPYPGIIDHPRARVALEERALGLPSWLMRRLYKLFVPRTMR